MKTLKKLIAELSLLHKTGMPYKMVDIQIVTFIKERSFEEKEEILHEVSKDIADNEELTPFGRRVRLLILVPLVAYLTEEENAKESGECKN